jgi:phage-related minor tail protein
MKISSTIGSTSDSGGGGFWNSLWGAFGGACASGGSVLAGSTYLVGERGPELFTAPATGGITPNNRLYAAQGGGDVNTSIVINVQKDGSSTTNVSGDSPEAMMNLARVIENVTKQTIQKEMRLGNSLNPIFGR